MKKFDLGQTISIVANVGVIAGLVFVGLQIQQERDIAQANRVLSNSDAYRNWAEIVAENSELWAKGIAGEPLSPAESVAFHELAEARQATLYVFWQSAVLTGREEAVVDALVREAALEFSSHPGLITFLREHQERMKSIGLFSEYDEQVNEEIARLQAQSSALTR